jgi:hypothetical protein
MYARRWAPARRWRSIDAILDICNTREEPRGLASIQPQVRPMASFRTPVALAVAGEAGPFGRVPNPRGVNPPRVPSPQSRHQAHRSVAVNGD